MTETAATTCKVTLDVNNLWVSYIKNGIEKEVIKGVSLEVDQGEVLALVGESGSGKTVFGKAIMGLLPDSAKVSAEHMIFEGREMKMLGEREMCKIRGKDIAMIFQDPMTSLDPTMSVGSQIGEAIKAHNKFLNKRQIKEKAINLLKMVGIPEPEIRYDSYPYHFSGGMRQRCAIAMALSSGPKLLIADEPTTALDVTIQAQMLELLLELKRKLSMSIIFITHDLGVVANVADRVAVMENGIIVECRDVRDVFYGDRLPYTDKLLKSLPYFSKPLSYTIDKNENENSNEINLTRDNLQDNEKEKIILSVRNLTKIYHIGRKKQIKAVHQVSFDILEDEIFGIVGESGSGKSTIAKCIMNIDKASEGKIDFQGIELTDKKSVRKNKTSVHQEIQIIFQDSMSSLNPRMSALNIISEPLALAGRFKNKTETYEYVKEMITESGLDDSYLDRKPTTMSGGERQRVSIARAFGMKPKLLVADEPIASLDVTMQKQIVGLFRHLKEEHNCAILFIAHDLSMVRYLCDRVGVMCQGDMVEIGTAKDVFENPLHEYTKSLIAAIPIPDPDERFEEKMEKASIIRHNNCDNIVDHSQTEMMEVTPGHFVRRLT